MKISSKHALILVQTIIRPISYGDSMSSVECWCQGVNSHIYLMRKGSLLSRVSWETNINILFSELT